MANKRYMCRTHQGGIFSMPPRKGRPPVRCTPEHPCDKQETPMEMKERTSPIGKPAQTAAKATAGANDSLPLAMAAKARLEPLEWVVKGRAWIEGSQHFAEVVCSRGAETLIIRWLNGVLTDQQYSMENLRQSENGIPPHKLSFNPDELTDGELVRMVRGMKVTWWNTIASSPETAIVGPSNIAVEHLFVGGGDTDNSKRIIKFLDHGGGGFRAFHVGALLKVG